jgi:hypothetical protein
MISAFEMPRRKSSLNPQEVDRLSEGMILAAAVDTCQMPHNGGQVGDSPERSLARAILFDAVSCAVRHHTSALRKQRLEAIAALAWIQDPNGSWFLSFPRICDSLGIGEDYLRELVMRTIRQTQSEVSHAAAA